MTRSSSVFSIFNWLIFYKRNLRCLRWYIVLENAPSFRKRHRIQLKLTAAEEEDSYCRWTRCRLQCARYILLWNDWVDGLHISTHLHIAVIAKKSLAAKSLQFFYFLFFSVKHTFLRPKIISDSTKQSNEIFLEQNVTYSNTSIYLDQ